MAQGNKNDAILDQSIPKEDPTLFLSASTIKLVLLAWLIPGMGYYLLGRKRACLLISICVLTAFFMGIYLEGDLFPWGGEGKIRAIGSLCQLGAGIPYAIAKLFVDRGSPLSVTYDYGTNYLLIAGMINWLAVMDTFDIAVKRK